MKPTPTRGICGRCQEPNPYTETNCVRCNARLVWAFLIDGKEDENIATPVNRFFNRFFDVRKTENRTIHCRFCDGLIDFDEKICPHCKNWLATAGVSQYGWSLVDPDAPEIMRLVEQNKKRNP